MKASILSLEGKKVGELEIDIPEQRFIKEEVIRKAVLAEQSLSYQPKGSFRWAGLQTSAAYFGKKDSNRSMKNRGISRLPREILPLGKWGKVRRVPFSVKGRRAHPPRVDKVIIEKINNREKKVAFRNAILASFKPEYVKARGHIIPEKIMLPLIVENKMQEMAKAKEIVALAEKLNLFKDLERAEKGRKKRSSARGGRRRGGYRTPKSILFIIDEDKGIKKACENIPGVECAAINELKVEQLAPGTHAGRLAVWAEAAARKIGEKI